MSELPTTIFARRLRDERRSAGLTQTELAHKMSGLMSGDVYGSTITRIETGERLVKLDEAVAAAEVFGLPLLALISDADYGVEAQIREVELKLVYGRSTLLAATQELERRQHQVAELEEQLTLLKEDERVAVKAEVEQEWAEDLDSARWPGQ